MHRERVHVVVGVHVKEYFAATGSHITGLDRDRTGYGIGVSNAPTEVAGLAGQQAQRHVVLLVGPEGQRSVLLCTHRSCVSRFPDEGRRGQPHVPWSSK